MVKVIQASAAQIRTRLSPNFLLLELTDSDKARACGINNAPDNLALSNLFKTAELLEKVRTALGGKAILVSSGYRSVALNDAVGGSSTSDHLRGEAADFRCPAFGTPLDVCHAIVASGIKFGQLIYEGTWVHISIPDGSARDGEVLQMKVVNGKATYLRGLPAKKGVSDGLE
jgi:zinc D-Ala-D-Ala carboxypeptidase